MKILLFRDQETNPMAEFNEVDLPLEKQDTIFLTIDGENIEAPYTVVDIIYNVSIWNGRADLEKDVYLKMGVIKE